MNSFSWKLPLKSPCVLDLEGHVVQSKAQCLVAPSWRSDVTGIDASADGGTAVKAPAQVYGAQDWFGGLGRVRGW